MAIALDCISLIIPIEKIEQSKYPGGLKGLLESEKASIGTVVLTDKYLYKTGAMSPEGIKELVDYWKKQGLKPFEIRGKKQYWKDMCVVDFLFGPTRPCDWIEYDWANNTVWLKGFPKGSLAKWNHN